MDIMSLGTLFQTVVPDIANDLAAKVFRLTAGTFSVLAIRFFGANYLLLFSNT